MLIAVLSGFVLAAFAPWIHRLAPRSSAWLLALLPLGLTGYFLGQAGAVAGGEPVRTFHPWAPSLGVNLSFALDGLGLTCPAGKLPEVVRGVRQASARLGRPLSREEVRGLARPILAPKR